MAFRINLSLINLISVFRPFQVVKANAVLIQNIFKKHGYLTLLGYPQSAFLLFSVILDKNCNTKFAYVVAHLFGNIACHVIYISILILDTNYIA